MHYYQFNISDWALHASHLTLEEDAIYRRLLDFYYDTESPISNNPDDYMRRLRLVKHRDMVADILLEFFDLEDDGWHNKRADAEIARYHAKAETAKINGAKGGRPKKITQKEPIPNPEETQPVILANPEETGSKANYELLTKNYELETNNNKPEDQKTMPGKPDVGQRSVIDYLNLKSSSNYQPVAANIKLISGRLAEGRTVEEIKQVIDRQCMAWPPDHHMRKYLRPKTLFNAEKFNQYFGQLGQPIITEQQNGQSQRPNQPVGEVARIHATIDARAKARLEALQSGWGGLHEGGAGLEEV